MVSFFFLQRPTISAMYFLLYFSIDSLNLAHGSWISPFGQRPQRSRWPVVPHREILSLHFYILPSPPDPQDGLQSPQVGFQTPMGVQPEGLSGQPAGLGRSESKPKDLGGQPVNMEASQRALEAWKQARGSDWEDSLRV